MRWFTKIASMVLALSLSSLVACTSASESSNTDVENQAQQLEITAPTEFDESSTGDNIYMTWTINNTTNSTIHDIELNYASLDGRNVITETPSWSTGDMKVKPGQGIDRFTGFKKSTTSVELTGYSYKDEEGNKYEVDLSDNPITVEIVR